MDVQGPKVVKRYTDKASVQFPVAVDTADIFGDAFGLKVVPITYLIDEAGIIRLRGGGPSPELLRKVEQVLKEPIGTARGDSRALPGALSRVELEKRLAATPGDWRARLALAQHLESEGRMSEALAQCAAAAKDQPREPSIYMTWGLILWQGKQQEAALARLKQARDLAPDNWRIRKQIWALENPEKFYDTASPDYDWQKQQLEREKSAK